MIKTRPKEFAKGRSRSNNGEVHVSDNDDAFVRRLDVIIRLVMEQQLADKSLQKKQHLMILDSVGLTSREIGTILGQPPKDVSSWLKRIKAGKTATEKSG